LSGKVTSICASPSTGYVAAGALDRYLRLLSCPVSSDSGQTQGHGNVVGKLYVTAGPTAIIPLVENAEAISSTESDVIIDKEEDDDWNNLREVSSDDEGSNRNVKKRQKKA
ncbi:hypothetical protein FRC17_006681, partial [Serendipita sp. 399]